MMCMQHCGHCVLLSIVVSTTGAGRKLVGFLGMLEFLRTSGETFLCKNAVNLLPLVWLCIQTHCQADLLEFSLQPLKCRLLAALQATSSLQQSHINLSSHSYSWGFALIQSLSKV